jgi:hypothetical protein
MTIISIMMKTMIGTAIAAANLPPLILLEIVVLLVLLY